MTWRKLIALLAVAAALGVAAFSLTRPDTPTHRGGPCHGRGCINGGAATANIWVSTGGGSCTRSASLVAYVAGNSCGSLNAANSICQGGDLAYVKAGTYVNQVISGSNGRSGTRCTIQAAPSEVSTFSVDSPSCTACNPVSIQVQHATYLTLDGFATGFGMPVLGHQIRGRCEVDDTGGLSDNVTLNNMHCGAISIRSTNITISNSDMGPSEDPSNMRVDTGINVTFNNDVIHDFRADNGGHMECMTLEAGTNNLLIENSTFSNCADFSIFAKPSAGTPISGVTIVNTIFYHPLSEPSSNDIKFTNTGGGTCNNIKIIFNRLQSNIYDNECTDAVVVKGNVMHSNQAACGSGWDYNIWDASVTTCGSHASISTQAALFTNAATGDFHPLVGSLSLAYVPTFAAAPATDKDGNTRPNPPATNLDAGPYER